MAGTAVWTTPRDYTTGETITDTILNQQLRDNPTYVKAVLGGTSLQDVTINAAKRLLHGTFDVVRTPQTGLRHLEGGTISVASTQAITFADAFAANPVVTTASQTVSNVITVTTLGTTGATLSSTNPSSGYTTSTGHWLAWGAD